MNTIATIAGDSWSISIGGGWIILTLVGMGLCFVFMLGPMWLIRLAAADAAPGPLDLLDRRFAEGAVSIDDYHRRREILTGATIMRSGAGRGSDKNEGSKP